MLSLTFKSLFIFIFAFTLGACSADSESKDKKENPDARRKLDPTELDRVMKVVDNLDDMDAAEFPLGRLFGDEQADPEEPVGEKMYALLKPCTVNNKADETQSNRSANGVGCPVNYSKTEKFKKDGDTVESESNESYNVIDKSYLLEGNITSFFGNGYSHSQGDIMKANDVRSFSSNRQGEGTTGMSSHTTSTKVSESRADFVINTQVELMLKNRGLCTIEDKPSCIPSIVVKLILYGYVEVVNGNLSMDITKQECFLDGRQFDCNSAGAFALQNIKSPSLALARKKALQTLR